MEADPWLSRGELDEVQKKEMKGNSKLMDWS
jgi:hypothetical protein